MTLSQLTYLSGVKLALEQHGVSSLERRLPFGPMHLGAERLAKALSQEGSPVPTISARKEHKLERATRWGNPTSLEAGSNTLPGPVGMGQYGGV